MIDRNLSPVLRDLAHHYPVVTVTGPRQSGKTTLCRAAFGNLGYASLEPLDVRSFARQDPRGFLAEHHSGVVIDEVQHAPELLSYIQEAVDADPAPGRFILTGSQHLGLLEAVSQSLAGRSAVVHLLPLSLDEVLRFGKPLPDLWSVLWTGSYPRIHDRRLPAGRWLADYVTTYVQRDVRQVLNVGSLEAFDSFVRLCAGRTATELNLSTLGADAGVSHNTARSWLSVLEAGFIVFRAPAWRKSLRKQIVKAPKLHFVDSGLVCGLLGITEPTQLRHHPLRGRVFESWVASEVYKARVHRGLAARLFHFRDAKGLEVDLVVDRAGGPTAVEAKSAATIAAEFFRPFERFAQALGEPPFERVLVFGGEEGYRRQGVMVLPWHRIQEFDWT
jgi:predicted AAA+ superfamily ATPase